MTAARTTADRSHIPTEGFRARLLAFFDARARDLPWRGTSDPYAILVSEIMLQQTRVETVVPYYRSWMARFPKLSTLAHAEEEAVLLAWRGLGYYRRARNLHAAAREIEARHGGRIPDDPKALRALPGVGAYTSGAVASIAFGVPIPAVDGNVRRVFSRLLDAEAPGAALLEREVGRLVDPGRPGDFNQALMELGATLCAPQRPRCTDCPVARWCLARARGTQEARPAPPRRREVPRLVEAVAVVTWKDGEGVLPPRVLVEPRPAQGLLGGMWQAPSLQVGENGDLPEAASLLEAARTHALAALGWREEGPARVREGAGVVLQGLLPAVDHVFTHRRVTYRPVALEVVGAAAPPDPGEGPGGPRRWATARDLASLPLPRAQERILHAWAGASGGAESPAAP